MPYTKLVEALQDEGSKMDDPESKKQLLGFKVCFCTFEQILILSGYLGLALTTCRQET